jgi:predicted protein tyrosine phosphatase
MRKGLRAKEGSSANVRTGPLRVLFICSRNRKRSPTAEAVFGAHAELDVASAGLAPDAEEVVTPETLQWAELIFVMEKVHRTRLQRRFGPHLRHARIVCLDIKDDYEFMDEELIRRLEVRVSPHLARLRPSASLSPHVTTGPLDHVEDPSGVADRQELGRGVKRG